MYISEIFNAANGKSCDGGPNGKEKINFNNLEMEYNEISILFHLMHPELEFAAGFDILINITNPNGTTGNNMTPHNIYIGRLLMVYKICRFK